MMSSLNMGAPAVLIDTLHQLYLSAGTVFFFSGVGNRSASCGYDFLFCQGIIGGFFEVSGPTASRCWSLPIPK